MYTGDDVGSYDDDDNGETSALGDKMKRVLDCLYTFPTLKSCSGCYLMMLLINTVNENTFALFYEYL